MASRRRRRLDPAPAVDGALPASAQKVQDALAAASVAAAAGVRQLPVAARTAAGTPHSIFPTTFRELLALTRGAPMNVAGDGARGSDS